MSGSTNQPPFVSVIVTCHNERDFIGQCIESILRNDFPKDRLEILVVDGMSDDGTRDVLKNLASHHPSLTILDNTELITPTALNIGIKRAKGQYVLWMSGHSEYPADYISKCVSAALKYDADNVGGGIIALSRTDTPMGHAIACAISHPFGVGNSHFRTRPKEPKLVDTVFGGCYKISVFARIGLFNEKLVRGQDLELNLRLKAAGGKILLVPEVVSNYYARSDLRSFWKHNWLNGMWALLPFTKSCIVPVSVRHLVPLAFILSLLITPLLPLAWSSTCFLFPTILISYLTLNLIASLHAAWKAKQPQLFFFLPLAFATLHLGYGLGSFWGLVLVCKDLLLGRK